MNYNEGYYVRVTDLSDKREIHEVEQFLKNYSLTFTIIPDYTLAIYDSSENRIIATGSLQGEVLKNIAVDREWQGEGLMAEIVTNLLQRLHKAGKNHAFVYTKPENKALFVSLGFSFLGEALPYAILLEYGCNGVSEYCTKVSKNLSVLQGGSRAAIVMNCNPFTLGHRYLIERAASENEQVILFLLSEDRSEIPFKVRYNLVREGVSDLKNVIVVKSGNYIISSATFPDYFLKKREYIEAQTVLDADVFARNIASNLGITKRYIGTEPFCMMTAEYNNALKRVCVRYGIEVIEVERKKDENGEYISASKVRKCLLEKNFEKLRKILPEVTFQYFFQLASFKKSN